MVRLRRASQVADWLRAYKVIVDGEEVGSIRRGQEAVFDLAPGPHRMSLRIDWAGSNELELVSDGAPLELECGSNFAGWRAFLGIKHVVSAAPGYLWLRFKQAPASAS
jgi:hypothetical protein